MYEVAIEILCMLENNFYSAYIIGGYPRDKYLGIFSTDIDICTNARPMEVIKIFSNSDISNIKYGCVIVNFKGYKFSVTTFRREYEYLCNRSLIHFDYVDTLSEDLIRRDFIMNTLAIDKDGNYVDLYGAKKDIDSKIIRCVGDSFLKLNEDYLRILRAIRFATILNFKISLDLDKAIYDNSYKVKNLSNFRKKVELDKIFKSKNVMHGINLLKHYNLDKVLNLNLSHIKYCENYLGIWAQVLINFDFPFTRAETKSINAIRFLLTKDNPLEYLDKYSLDMCLLASKIKENN